MKGIQDYAAQQTVPQAGQPRLLRSGALTCLYHNGFLRYLCLAGKEVIRSLYPAIRNESWETAPALISDESVREDSSGFSIAYTAAYSLGHLRYTAVVEILARGGEEVTYSFQGTADTGFLRNRIGLCLLLPPDRLKGNSFTVGHPDGSSENGRFPDLVQPGCPAQDICRFSWEPDAGSAIVCHFTGDVFEMEDQRNYGDASYKIYSTPHALPVPVAVSSGDRVRQSVRVEIRADPPRLAPSGGEAIVFQTGGPGLPLPSIGYGANSDGQSLDAGSLRLLRRIPFDHYRVELPMAGNWREPLVRAMFESEQLQTRLLLVLYLSAAERFAQAAALTEAIGNDGGRIGQLLLMDESGRHPVPAWFAEMAAWFRARLPGIKTGAGTDTFFADWNTQFSVEPGMDFTAFPLNPQAHLADRFTIIENLGAQADIVETARKKAGSIALAVSPVTLRMRFNPDAVPVPPHPARRKPFLVDERQASWLAAAWTTLSLRHLSGAGLITLYETTGDRGLMPAATAETGLAVPRVYPLYLSLREIAAFHPDKIMESRSVRPLDADGIVLENSAGERLIIVANLSSTIQTIQLKTETWKVRTLFGKRLAASMFPDLLEDGEKFRATPYVPFPLAEGNACQLAPETMLFLTTLQDWSFGY